MTPKSSAQETTVPVVETNGTNPMKFWFMPGSTWATTNGALGSFTFTFAENEDEQERGMPFEGVLAVVGSPTSDGRYLIPDEIGYRALPIPFLVQTATEGGHIGAETCGRIEEMNFIPIADFDRKEEFNLQDVRDEAVVVWATGTFDTSEFADDAERMIENGAGVSIDMPPDRVAMFDPETYEEIPEEEVDWEQAMMGAYLVGIAGSISAATIVSIPAFEEASVVLVPGHALVASAYGLKVVREGVLTAAAAGAAPLKPPMDWFFADEPDFPTPLTVTDDGQVYGHLALWDQCHVGFAGCERAPRSHTDYSYFHLGEVETDDGESVNVGRITVGEKGGAKGGHASVVLGRQGAVEHYDNAGCAAAFVRASNGRLGIWLSGAVRSDVPAERIRDLKANPPSGDWRDGELVGVLSVPVPGFPIPRVEALVASAENGEEQVMTLIASGYTPESYSEQTDAEIIDMPTYRKRLKELARKRKRMKRY